MERDNNRTSNEKNTGNAPSELSGRKRTRSPNYPVLSLREAFEKTKVLHDKEGQAEVPLEVAAKDLGYSSLSGSTRMVLSTLKKFGFLEDVRKQTVRVSDLAMSVLMPRDQGERDRALKEAFLKPHIHQELWEHYEGRLPSAEAMKAVLVRDYGFNKKVVDRFINNFLDSIEYSATAREHDQQAGRLSLSREGEPTQPERHHPRPSTSSVEFIADSGEHIGSTLPLGKGRAATVLVPSKLTESENDRLAIWLDTVVKPWLKLLVSNDEDTGGESHS